VVRDYLTKTVLDTLWQVWHDKTCCAQQIFLSQIALAGERVMLCWAKWNLGFICTAMSAALIGAGYRHFWHKLVQSRIQWSDWLCASKLHPVWEAHVWLLFLLLISYAKDIAQIQTYTVCLKDQTPETCWLNCTETSWLSVIICRRHRYFIVHWLVVVIMYLYSTLVYWLQCLGRLSHPPS